jgi:hypothetical protein
MSEDRHSPDTVVRLLPEFAGAYGLAPAGAVATVKRTKTEDGFQMVFIEWDPEHWTYAGERDMWTFANHFEAVKETSMAEPTPENPEGAGRDLPPGLGDALIDFLSNYAKGLGEDEDKQPGYDDDSSRATRTPRAPSS